MYFTIYIYVCMLLYIYVVNVVRDTDNSPMDLFLFLLNKSTPTPSRAEPQRDALRPVQHAAFGEAVGSHKAGDVVASHGPRWRTTQGTLYGD